MVSADFWDRTIIGIFFVYGLAFYSLGLALLIESGRSSQLSLARSMRLLAGFGLLHGTHEWIDMFERELALHYDSLIPEWLVWIRLAVLITSFIALLAFGEHLLRNKGGHNSWRITVNSTVVCVLGSLFLPLMYELSDREWANGIDVLSRYVLGIPGAGLSFWALWLQRGIFHRRGMGRFVVGLTVAAVAIIGYGLIGQIFVSESVFFPSTVINDDLFQDVLGFPVQLFRAAMAITVTVSMIYVLRALEFENEQRLEAAEWSKLEAERRSRDELARLNAELKKAHAEATRLLHEVQQRDALRGELLQRITTAQENERKRIARELHDGTGQILTGLALGLRGTASVVTKDSERAVSRLSDLEMMATTALGELRHLINDLRPPQLDDMGLAAALRWLINHVEQRDDVEMELDISGDPYALPPEVETTLFRIAQEGLNNIIKHAQAKHARIVLTFGPEIVLSVRDDGIGFKLEDMLNEDNPRMAWGLLGMQERVNLINADLTLASAPGQGTALTVRLTAPVMEQIEGEEPS
jgi:signal transduction histidine kinase